MPTLFVISGADQGCRFELIEPIERLGCDPSSTIQVHDTEVSRHHAEIRRVENDYEISDLNSSNGVFVNGQRVHRHNRNAPQKTPGLSRRGNVASLIGRGNKGPPLIRPLFHGYLVGSLISTDRISMTKSVSSSSLGLSAGT
ncbi:MAG: FHA domain-containing protein [Planctomycetes bacterium]|nr:FHA domain-containing protein [Planctomycetota bacterium]MBU4398254.1 FHA domain-containing protein [Planctomycetota bacterium]MCG2683306.1 FHA domain-containing protein [Planctomycetales bacterium]